METALPLPVEVLLLESQEPPELVPLLQVPLERLPETHSAEQCPEACLEAFPDSPLARTSIRWSSKWAAGTT